MIQMIRNTALLIALLLCFVGVGPQRMSAGPKPVVVNIIGADGRTVGTATLSEAAHGVKITLDIKSLPPGPHLLHIHQFPRCEPPDFKSAGAHFDPTGMGHGEHGPAALPAGDIPNFVLNVNADGTAHVTTVAPNVTLGNDMYSVLSNGGSSIVIHAVADKVTAAAPPRIACGVIARTE
jgi:superoxide dismutase, Cu-Zn family